MVFSDRTEAGWLLGRRLAGTGLADDAVVCGLPRGGVSVASQVAAALGAPLDVLLVRKLPVPFRPELAMGAIGEGGVRVVDEQVVRRGRVTAAALAAVEARERAVLDRRARRYRRVAPRLSIAGHGVVIVDDGVATGSTARAACAVARAAGAARVVVAVPVAPAGWEAVVGPVADELVCLESAKWFFAVGQFYEDFSQVTDAQVLALLERSGHRIERRAAPRVAV